MPRTTPSDTGGGSRRRRLSRLPARLIAVCAALGAVLLAPGPAGTAEAAGSGNGDVYWNIGEPNRAVDIRVRATENKYFTVHHGVVYQEANFDDVLGKTRDFLAGHPGETVVMRLRCRMPRHGGRRPVRERPGHCGPRQDRRDLRPLPQRVPRPLLRAVGDEERAGTGAAALAVRGKIVLGSFDGVANT